MLPIISVQKNAKGCSRPDAENTEQTVPHDKLVESAEVVKLTSGDDDESDIDVNVESDECSQQDVGRNSDEVYERLLASAETETVATEPEAERDLDSRSVVEGSQEKCSGAIVAPSSQQSENSDFPLDRRKCAKRIDSNSDATDRTATASDNSSLAPLSERDTGNSGSPTLSVMVQDSGDVGFSAGGVHGTDANNRLVTALPTVEDSTDPASGGKCKHVTEKTQNSLEASQRMSHSTSSSSGNHLGDLHANGLYAM